MAYRQVQVDGDTYAYTVGRTHVKVRGWAAVRKEVLVNVQGAQMPKQRVTPWRVQNWIRVQLAALS